MDQIEPKSLSGGQEPVQEPQPATHQSELPSHETLSPDSCSVVTDSRSREAGDDLSSSPPRRGILPTPKRARRGNESTTSRIIERIVEIRRELFGDEGIPAIAEALHLPHDTWVNYERGVVMPAHVLLYFIDQTSVEPHWLLTGRGPKYRGAKGRFADSTGDDRIIPGKFPPNGTPRQS